MIINRVSRNLNSDLPSASHKQQTTHNQSSKSLPRLPQSWIPKPITNPSYKQRASTQKLLVNYLLLESLPKLTAQQKRYLSLTSSFKSLSQLSSKRVHKIFIPKLEATKTGHSSKKVQSLSLSPHPSEEDNVY